jgi:hypothetical protein
MRSSVRVRAKVGGTSPLTPKIAARFVDLSRERERLEFAVILQNRRDTR